MAPEVLQRKLAYLQTLLLDLAPYEDATLAEITAEHYKLERIFELLVLAATDILNHLLAERGLIPTTYREAYKLGAEQGLLPADLGERLQEAASMRNLIVHLYERIDYRILHQSIKPALSDFGELVLLFEEQLTDDSS